MRPEPEDQKNSLRRQVYLLTCWQEQNPLHGSVIWRFRVEIPRSDHPLLFKTLSEVMSKIEMELESSDK